MDAIFTFFSSANGIFYAFAYLVGSIPFGYALVKIFFGENLLKSGSGSIGATNVYRVVKIFAPKSAKKFMIATIFLDSIKGVVVILLGKIFGLPYAVLWLGAIFVVIGHCNSIFLFFNGGKGVTTAIGSTILLMPVEGALGLVMWALVGKILKISSLSSLFGVLFGIFCTFFIPSWLNLPEAINIEKQIGTHIPVIFIGFMVFWAHLPNIYRLLLGHERKITA